MSFLADLLALSKLIYLLLIVIFCFRRFSSFVYSFAIIDIFLRLLHFLEINVPVPELQNLISKYKLLKIKKN